MKLYVKPLGPETGLWQAQRIYGPMLMGVFCSLILYGILVMQFYSYYTTYKSDLRIIRCLPLVIDFGKESILYNFPATLAAEPILTVLVSTPIQVFTAWRIWGIQNSFWIPVFVCILALVSAAGGIWTGVAVAVIGTFAGSPKAYPAVYLWLFSSVTADILITGSLTIILSKLKTGRPSSDTVLSRIVFFTIQTGLITSVAAIADVVLLLALPIYAISLIASSSTQRFCKNIMWAL
ncbi:hypothetical protein GALMADRAFT_1160790 [Galerina marginata CBS 339.88]|uniref:DUF6534 domain-containing protein n=1 Tax=Galerina marginata (strain CBS 339.88) TaxID=685588 RepID=A0A067SHJ1_GALM3|nr:hypothetical protein GALMADRAFT_1160790 [Galerina marginata CBS 339.88]